MKIKILVLAASILWGGKALADEFTMAAPEQIMQNADRIGLGLAERQKIMGLVQQFQPEMTRVQTEISDLRSSISEALRLKPADKVRVLGLVDKLLAAESKLRRRHTELLIEINNELTDQQADQLRAK